jgi:hypothetical protein
MHTKTAGTLEPFSVNVICRYALNYAMLEEQPSIVSANAKDANVEGTILSIHGTNLAGKCLW